MHLWSNLKEIWQHRELLYFLIWRDVKVRYKQTLLGFGWVVIQPLLITVVFTLILSRYAHDFTQKVPYWLFAFSGFAIWTFVSTAISNSAVCFVNHKELVTKIYFPRLIMPLASVLASGLDLMINLAILIVAAVATLGVLSWKILMLPFFIVLIFLFTIAVSILLSALNVRYRDVKHLLPFGLQLLMFATPVFYSLELIPEKFRLIWQINPLTGAFEAVRASLFDLEFNLFGILISSTLTLASFLIAIYVFSKMEDSFADII